MKEEDVALIQDEHTCSCKVRQHMKSDGVNRWKYFVSVLKEG